MVYSKGMIFEIGEVVFVDFFVLEDLVGFFFRVFFGFVDMNR